jgi:hypothetical protein
MFLSNSFFLLLLFLVYLLLLLIFLPVLERESSYLARLASNLLFSSLNLSST